MNASDKVNFRGKYRQYDVDGRPYLYRIDDTVEYNAEKYEFRLSGLLNYFKSKNLSAEECERFMLFGGECNYLLTVSFALEKIYQRTSSCLR